jgi:energy-coupling factor transport system ATP-binding protein
MEKGTIIEFKHFTFKYFSQEAPTLVNINLKINKGEKVLIVGPSGSGKSTLGNCLNGLIPFAYRGELEGQTIVGDLVTTAHSIYDLSKIIGTVLQDSDGQFVGLTVGEDIAFAMENDQVLGEEMHKRVLQVAEMVGMDQLLGASPYELSGGQKQRTALAGVMIDHVDVLLFDEPLANLDPATGKLAIEIIDDIHRSTEKTVIIIEHRLEDVLHRPVDRIILINDGKIVADMKPHQMVASDLLCNHGIREPLYATAIKYSGMTLTEGLKPGYMDSVDVEAVKAAVTSWYQSQPNDHIEPEREALLSVEGINFSYDGQRPIVSDINFKIGLGEMVAVVGTNGAGKSTLAKLLCGFEKEDSGIMRYKGQSIANLSIKERAEIIGYVMQNPNQMISKNLIYDEVALGLRLRGLGEKAIKPKIDHVLKICGLAPFIDWPISALSYGQRKRVTIAAILVLEPKILILDEPTAGHDFKHYSEIMHFLEDINKTGVTIIMITHDMHLMLEYTDRAIVLAEGRIIADATAAEVITNDAVIQAANLKETSLYTLAKAVELDDPTSFVQCFIDYERQVIRGQ